MTQPLQQELVYRKRDGALMLHCPLDEDLEVGMTRICFPHLKEIGEWPFFDELKNSWTIRPGQMVTPSYKVVCRFQPNLVLLEQPLVLSEYIKEDEIHMNITSPFLTAAIRKIETSSKEISTAAYALNEIKGLNSELQTLYKIHRDMMIMCIESGGFIPPVFLAALKSQARRIIADMRQILLILLVPYLEIELQLRRYDIEDFSSVIDAKKDCSFEFLPPIGKYLNFLNLIRDLDNCFKHERGERQLSPNIPLKPAIILSKLNSPGHNKIWRIPEKKCSYVDYSRQEFWHYSIEFDALTTLFSSFLSELLELPDPKCKDLPPVLFQISEDWSLADTLPDKDSRKKESKKKLTSWLEKKS